MADRAVRTVCLALALQLAAAPSLLAAPAEDHWSIDADPAPASAAQAALQEAAALIEAKRFAQALPLLETLAQEDPANADIFNLLGFAARKTGDLETGARAYRRALALDPDHLGALEYQGELFLQQGAVAAAETNLARLRALCPAGCEEAAELAAAIAAWRAARRD